MAKRGGIWLQCGAHQLHIGIQEDFIPANKAHPAFNVENLEALRKQVIDQGIKVKEDEPLESAKRWISKFLIS